MYNAYIVLQYTFISSICKSRENLQYIFGKSRNPTRSPTFCLIFRFCKNICEPFIIFSHNVYGFRGKFILYLTTKLANKFLYMYFFTMNSSAVAIWGNEYNFQYVYFNFCSLMNIFARIFTRKH